MNLPLAAANLPNRLPPPIDTLRRGKTSELAGVAKLAQQVVPDSVPAAARFSRLIVSAGFVRARRSKSRGRSSTVLSMVPSGLLNVSQASANSATSPSVLVKGVPSIASAIASDGNGLLDVGVTHGVVCVSNGGFVLCDHDEDRVCCGDRRQRNRPRWSGGAGGDGKEATSGNNS